MKLSALDPPPRRIAFPSMQSSPLSFSPICCYPDFLLTPPTRTHFHVALLGTPSTGYPFFPHREFILPAPVPYCLRLFSPNSSYCYFLRPPNFFCAPPPPVFPSRADRFQTGTSCLGLLLLPCTFPFATALQFDRTDSPPLCTVIGQSRPSSSYTFRS